jgi:hypothetical protein
MSRKLSCIITGKTITIGEDYYHKKVQEFGSEQTLIEQYCCKQAKNLLVRGYGVDEIRSLLKVDRKMPVIKKEIIDAIRVDNDADALATQSVSVKKSDPEVAAFIANIRNLNC